MFAGLPEGVSEQAITAQLDRILASTAFAHSDRLSRFLRVAVEGVTQGHSDCLKEYSLALSVFDKRDSFDPRFDPIVRVEAGRLRTRLKQYYETEGLHDSLIIDLPKGSYVPRFALHKSAEPEPAKSSYSLNSIAVLPVPGSQSRSGPGIFLRWHDRRAHQRAHQTARTPRRRLVFGSSFARQDARCVGLAEQLKVGTVVAGSVRKSGDRLRITVQLIGTSDGCYLWSEIYDRELKDVFSIQEEISQAIVAKLKVQIAGGQNKHLIRRYTESFEAYNLYLKGRYHWNQRSERSLRKGIEYFEQAIALDPQYAPAYSGLADSYSLLGNYGVLPAK